MLLKKVMCHYVNANIKVYCVVVCCDYILYIYIYMHQTTLIN